MLAPDTPNPDVALVRDVLAGRAAAVQRLADRLKCVPRILAAENARLGRPLDANDLADTVQDTILILLRKLGEFRGHGALEAWACQVCRFELRNAIRRRRRDLPNLAEDLAETAPSGVAAREWAQLFARDELETALVRLGGADAEALRQRHFEGLSITEMAARAGISADGMKARYYRALARLEQLLGHRQHKEAIRGRTT